MSTHVVGFRPPDERWERMKAAWEACRAADIPVPADVYEFFGGMPPDPTGIKTPLDAIAETWSDDTSLGYEIDLADLPRNITKIRFYNSY